MPDLTECEQRVVALSRALAQNSSNPAPRDQLRRAQLGTQLARNALRALMPGVFGHEKNRFENCSRGARG